MARVDFERRVVSAAVRELVAPPERSRAGGVTAQLRARLGRDVHAAYQRDRAERAAGFRAEVPVCIELEVDGFAVTVRGRIDGLVERGDELVVEEVKSVLASGDQLEAVSVAPHHAAQVRLYALCAGRAFESPAVRAQLVYVSIVDGARRAVDIPFHAGVARDELESLIRAAIARAEAERRRAESRARAARHLQFPYAEVRPHQGALIDHIAGGLGQRRPVVVEAPTGIGKTVSAVLSGMRHALACNARVMFVTAKATQRQLVARTFEDIVAASGPEAEPLVALTLRAKDRMCPPGHRLCHPDVCEYLREFDRRAEITGAVDGLLAGGHVDPESVYRAGASLRLCPFELSMEVARDADLVIGDYNHVYDRSHAIAGDEPTERSDSSRAEVVIVDEAHNLVDRARGYYSPFIAVEELADISARIRAGQLAATGAVAESQLVIEACGRTISAPVFRDAVALFDELREGIASLACGRQTTGGCARIRPSADAFDAIADRATALMVRYAHYKRTHELVVSGDELMGLLRSIVRLRDLVAAGRDELVVYVAAADARRGAGIGVACVDPAHELARCHRAAAGTVIMSATLAPVGYFCDVLGLAGLDPVIASVGSPFPVANREVVIVSSVSTAFRRRDGHAADIASLIDRIVAVEPGCYAAFFSSYQFMDRIRGLLRSPPEQLLVQHRDMTEADRAEVLGQLRAATGPRLLLGVTGGVFSEGVDLPGDALIGAIVVGPSLPPPDFERSQMRGYFDAAGGDGFAYSMIYPGMQRAIQAAGRVIRTMSDRGVVALLGARFATPTYANCLPSDWYARSPAELVTSDPVARIERFWRDRIPSRATGASSRYAVIDGSKGR